MYFRRAVRGSKAVGGFLFWAGAAALMAVSVRAWDARFYAVDLRVQPQISPPALVLSWPAVDYARQYFVRRKLPLEQSWKTLATLPGDAAGFTDPNAAAGTGYEYEVQLETTDPAPEGGFISAYTYAFAGSDVRENDAQGKVILVVDDSVASALTGDLELFRSDLIGAGWTVVQRTVSRTGEVRAVKQVILDEYNADPANVRSVVLIGHVPVPYSGNIAPDMHSSHRGAWPADAYYADMDGTWTDDTVSVTSGDNAENDNFPGDGKFDQSVLPSPVELEIGRIDMWGLDEFQGRSEVDLLRNYFGKDHAFRHRIFTAPRQGLIRDNFGDLDGDAPAVDAWRHFGLFFGPNREQEVGPGEFFPALSHGGYLWAYGCGGGANDKADGVGTTLDFANSDPGAVFFILHGSYFGDWNYRDNFLRAAIATPSYSLVSIWSGLPHWFLHSMALGKTVGYSTRMSQNNLNLYKSYRNFSPREAHISLIGDPTLEMFPVAPPSDLTASDQGSVQLVWRGSPDENLLGYHVYHASAAQGPYSRITTAPVTGTSFSHAAGVGVHYYMVRAVKLEQTGSGSYRNLSQGIFATISKSSGGISTPPTISVIAEDTDAGEFRANSGTFRFTRDSVDGTALEVSFVLSGTAENGVDYFPVGNSVMFQPGSSSAILSIYPRTDSLIEGDETVTVTIQLSGAANYRIGSPASATLVIRDDPPDQRPSIGGLADVTVDRGAPLKDLAFSIHDAETAAEDLLVSASSSNQDLVPDSGIHLGGGGENRTIGISPAPGQTGTAKITVSVSDGVLDASATFLVTVTEPVVPVITQLIPEPGSMLIRFRGAPAREFVIESSFDAVHWGMLGQAISNAEGVGEFRDTNTARFSLKFYRLDSVSELP